MSRIGLRIWTIGVVLFLWIPLVLIMVYAFNSSKIQSWPIPGWTFHWFRDAWNDPDFLKDYEKQGEKKALDPGARATVDLHSAIHPDGQ